MGEWCSWPAEGTKGAGPVWSYESANEHAFDLWVDTAWPGVRFALGGETLHIAEPAALRSLAEFLLERAEELNDVNVR